jgi:hypothetical protein
MCTAQNNKQKRKTVAICNTMTKEKLDKNVVYMNTKHRIEVIKDKRLENYDNIQGAL